MAEALKNVYTQAFIDNLCQHIRVQYADFDDTSFTLAIFDKHWQEKELKQRMRHIAQCLHLYLPANYQTSINILKPVSKNFSSYEAMFFQDYVECFGLEHYKTSISALAHFTKYSSSEFAVRVFILQNEKRMMKQMLRWATSNNHHVRRLASEGCRPRLPWAIALPVFKKNPQAVLNILKTLMFDDSEYVRRSVANNLNDISKDNPDTVLKWARRYLGNNKNTDHLIKHACRGLLKQGNQQALALFGYAKTEHINVTQFKVQTVVATGDELQFSFFLHSHAKPLGKCRLEFAIDFVKANGSVRRKVFNISEINSTDNKKHVEKYFSFKKISTRKYYAGKHYITIIINGIEQAKKPFILIP
ncbi:MAG: DNA alkylation repair protein [Gammaproteobacteria bacterium]|nr:DNA alkylation repair protein [Gammaproteobacteria bacterium]